MSGERNLKMVVRAAILKALYFAKEYSAKKNHILEASKIDNNMFFHTCHSSNVL